MATVGGFYSGSHRRGGYGYSAMSSATDTVRYQPCGHVVSGNLAASSTGCPVCIQEHTLKRAQVMHAQHSAQLAAAQQFQQQHAFSGVGGGGGGGSASAAGNAEMWRNAMMGSSPAPREPTMVEWLEAEVRSVCQLAFAV